MLRRTRIVPLLAAAIFCVETPGSFAQAQTSALSQTREFALPTQAALNRHNLTRRWWGSAHLNPARDRLSHISLDDTTLYAVSTGGLISAFDSETGERRWARQMGIADQPSFQPALDSERLLLIVGMSLYAIDKRTGDVVWQLRLPSSPSTSPVSDANNVYIGFLNGSMIAFNLKEVESLYKEGLLPQFSYSTVRWRYATNKPILVPAVSLGNQVHFASSNGSLYCVTSDDRTLIFQFETDAPVAAPLGRHKSHVFLASQDNRVYSIDAERGELKWSFPSGHKISHAPIVIGDDLFVLPDAGGMFRLDSPSGDEKWWNPAVKEFAAATGAVVYGFDADGRMALIDRATGKALSMLPLPGFSIRLQNDRTDRIYVATPRGTLLCLSERNRTEPTMHKYPERQPILPEFATDEEAAAAAAPPAEPGAEGAETE